ncbi:MAG: hypothetical protein IMW98_00315 [Firmicutes bacterium]|nr:hypothetical protein [Bacillota bacterium]
MAGEAWKVAALQFPLPERDGGPGSREAWQAELDRRVAAARQAGAEFVVLPPGAGAGPAGVPAVAAWARAGLHPRRLRRDAPPEDAWEQYCLSGAELARRHGVYLVPGSAVIPAGGGWQHAAGLFAPDGRLLGWQAQGHWTAEALAAGWLPSAELRPVECEGRVVALLLGYDAIMPEGFRLAERLGADLAVALTAWPVPHNPWRQVATVWSNVQQTQIPCVEACLVGPVRGRLYAGHSAVYGPCEGTPGESGWYAQADAPMGEAAVQATIKWDVVERVRREYPIARHLNPALYRRHFAAAYGAAPLEASAPPEPPVSQDPAGEVRP